MKLLPMLPLMALLSTACNNSSYKWEPTPDREDLRACNAARAGNYDGYERFHSCMYSMGYHEVEVQVTK